MSIRALLKIQNELRAYDRRQRRRELFWRTFAIVFIAGMIPALLSLLLRSIK